MMMKLSQSCLPAGRPACQTTHDHDVNYSARILFCSQCNVVWNKRSVSFLHFGSSFCYLEDFADNECSERNTHCFLCGNLPNFLHDAVKKKLFSRMSGEFCNSVYHSCSARHAQTTKHSSCWQNESSKCKIIFCRRAGTSPVRGKRADDD